MNKKFFLLSIFILALGACTPTNNGDEPITPKEEYILDEEMRSSLLEVREKYKNKTIDVSSYYQMSIINSQELGEDYYDELKADAANSYFYEDIQNGESFSGDAYFFKKDDEMIMAVDVTRYGVNDKSYEVLTETAYQMLLESTKEAPYKLFTPVLEEFVNLTNKLNKDASFTKSTNDKKGNISINLTLKEYKSESSETYTNVNYQIEIKDYIVYRFYRKSTLSNENSLIDYTYNQDHFELVYPDLSEYRNIDEDIPGEEEPLNENEKLVDFDNNRTYYQLLVYSFADSNGDGIGDFKGIADKLDYLQDLGVEGIWLSPILEATSYHSYDIEDYYRIHSIYNVTINGVTYGINYLLREAHKRNIKVLMDLVLNHTSYLHTWCSEHSDWYGNDNRFGFPEFNFDNQKVRKAVQDVGTYWLDRGFDGFRLDAAMWIYNSGSDRHQKNYEFWREWCSKMKEAKPDCYLIGEVLDDNHDLAYDYANAGFDSTFDFNALGNVINAVKNNNNNYAVNTASDIKKATNINENYILARALSNHDIGRFNQEHPDSSDKAYYVEDINQIKLANALNALTPGNTFVYYGDELGLKGTCEDTAPNWYYDMNYRTPMPWKVGRTRSEAYFNYFHGSGVTTSTTYSTKTAEEDALSNDSIYFYLKNALSLKNHNGVLQKGVVSKPNDLPSELNGFDATYNNVTMRVVFNTSGNAVNYQINRSASYMLNASLSNNTVSLQNYGLVAFEL